MSTRGEKVFDVEASMKRSADIMLKADGDVLAVQHLAYETEIRIERTKENLARAKNLGVDSQERGHDPAAEPRISAVRGTTKLDESIKRTQQNIERAQKIFTSRSREA